MSDPTKQPAPATCLGCGDAMSDEERTYYGDRCAGCERERWRRVRRWREGAHDPELDAFYTAPKTMVH